MGSILIVYNVSLKYMHGFIQLIEPRAFVGNNSVVFPSQLRCVKNWESNWQREDYQLEIVPLRGVLYILERQCNRCVVAAAEPSISLTHHSFI
jgi:hypothetical protein